VASRAVQQDRRHRNVQELSSEILLQSGEQFGVSAEPAHRWPCQPASAPRPAVAPGVLRGFGTVGPPPLQWEVAARRAPTVTGGQTHR
jgi:hypothetical protein